MHGSTGDVALDGREGIATSLTGGSVLAVAVAVGSGTGTTTSVVSDGFVEPSPAAGGGPQAGSESAASTQETRHDERGRRRGMDPW